MQSHAVSLSPTEIISNKERDILRQLLEKRLHIESNKIQFTTNHIQVLTEMRSNFTKEISLQNESKGNTEIHQNNKNKIGAQITEKITAANSNSAEHYRLDTINETISKPMRSLLDCKIDNDLTKLNTFYSTHPKLEQDARKAVNNLTDQLTTLQRTPPLPNSPITLEVGKTVAINSAHVDNLVNCTNALSTLFTRLETACALRAKVKEPAFEIESFTIDSIKKEAIECSKLRDEFLSIREAQLKDFIANWKDKIAAAKTVASDLSKTRDATKAKIAALYRPSNQPPREEAKVASPAAVRAC